VDTIEEKKDIDSLLGSGAVEEESYFLFLKR
jgi:hypothetical protein